MMKSGMHGSMSDMQHSDLFLGCAGTSPLCTQILEAIVLGIAMTGRLTGRAAHEVVTTAVLVIRAKGVNSI